MIEKIPKKHVDKARDLASVLQLHETAIPVLARAFHDVAQKERDRAIEIVKRWYGE